MVLVIGLEIISWYPSSAVHGSHPATTTATVVEASAERKACQTMISKWRFVEGKRELLDVTYEKRKATKRIPRTTMTRATHLPQSFQRLLPE